jgi:peptide/nickel transport system substrate-binding protein
MNSSSIHSTGQPRWLEALRIADTVPHQRLHNGGLLLLAVFAIHGCQPRLSRTDDDELVVLSDTAMKNADPRYAVTNHDQKLSKLVCAGLVAVDTPDLQPRMDLAQSVVHIDDLTWRATLRPSLLFSDGNPVTADDVAWTYNSMLAKDSDSLFHKNLAERFSSVIAFDSTTVEFKLIKPLATFMSDIDLGIVARHGAGPDGRFAGGIPVGAGAYQLLSLNAESAHLRANPHFWQGAAKLPLLTIKFVPDPAARALMLVGGSADLSQNGVRLDLLQDVIDRPRVAMATAPSVLLTYLLLNNEDSFLKDLRVRQAIALALDRQAIVDGKFGGRAILATGLLPPSHWAYAPDVTKWMQDLPRAKALLDQAGFPDPDGDGPKPRLSLVYKTSSDPFRVSVARVIAEQLSAIGLSVEVKPFEFATFLADIKKGQYQLASMQTTDITEPDFYYAYFHSSRIPSKDNPDGGNRWRYRNTVVDQATEAGRSEVDVAKRKPIYATIQAQVANDVPIVPLWHEDNVVVTNRRVHGYLLSPNARLSSLRLVTK